jgi:hypothetical protein
MYRPHSRIIAQHGIQIGLSEHQSPSKGQWLQTVGLRRQCLAHVGIMLQTLPPKLYSPNEQHAYNGKHNSICSKSLASTTAEQESEQLRPLAHN